MLTLLSGGDAQLWHQVTDGNVWESVPLEKLYYSCCFTTKSAVDKTQDYWFSYCLP